ncbi:MULTISPECIES: EcsC family protein [Calothrix]|uniref:EcsC family protein n=2 Tax=Calothrix TaxID=1186 RepID=A0ABR8A306_9CYAN|nr:MULTISPECIES: EcsC family protein [Calothrix]MBD2193939.1 EcsC family protein [Calothrix parietina FACHB-288]MBD2222946.1 EcsC family protein [Calothrix anomala FACHB-343]
MDLDSIMNMPGIGPIIASAIEDGRKWGKTFIQDSSWKSDKQRMANHAIYESTLWSVGNGIAGGVVGIAGIPIEIATTLYSQVKLASTLFTIYGIDTYSPSSQPLVLAAAAGVSVAELANTLGSKVAQQAIQKALMALPNKTFAQINKTLGIKLIAKTGEKAFLNVAKIVPFVGCAVGGTVNAVMMNACGHSVIAFIDGWNKG